METENVSTAQWKLRELATRALRVIERHKGRDVTLDAFEGTLVPAARSYIEVYDAAPTHESAQGAELREGDDSIADLDRRIRACLGVLTLAVPDFDGSHLMGRTHTPDRLVADGHRVIECVFQSIAITNSRASRSAVPGERDQGFQGIAISHSRGS